MYSHETNSYGIHHIGCTSSRLPWSMISSHLSVGIWCNLHMVAISSTNHRVFGIKNGNKNTSTIPIRIMQLLTSNGKVCLWHAKAMVQPLWQICIPLLWCVIADKMKRIINTWYKNKNPADHWEQNSMKLKLKKWIWRYQKNKTLWHFMSHQSPPGLAFILICELQCHVLVVGKSNEWQF